jgi:hypothetical protein
MLGSDWGCGMRTGVPLESGNPTPSRPRQEYYVETAAIRASNIRLDLMSKYCRSSFFPKGTPPLPFVVERSRSLDKAKRSLKWSPPEIIHNRLIVRDSIHRAVRLHADFVH